MEKQECESHLILDTYIYIFCLKMFVFMLSIREILQFREAKLRKNKNYQVEGISDKAAS